jgi:hypothetical protein
MFTIFFNNTSLIIETKENIALGFLLGFPSQENPQEAYIPFVCVNPAWRNK